MTAPGSAIVVLGLGNLICTDDGLGVQAAQALAADPRLPVGVEVVDGGTRGLDLLEHVCGTNLLLVLDAVETGEPAGTLVRVEHAELVALPHASDAHCVAVADLLNAAVLLGAEPEDVVLLGLQPERTTVGTSLSAPVAAALDTLVGAALAQLEEWSSRGRRND